MQIIILMASVLSSLAVVLTLFITLREFRNNSRLQRLKLVSETLNKLYRDRDLCEVYYIIEYGKMSKYEGELIGGGIIERRLDSLLKLFSNLALAWDAGLLSVRDLSPAGYYIKTILSDPTVKIYLERLDIIIKENSPFESLKRLSEQL